jgi:hypothetical protein
MLSPELAARLAEQRQAVRRARAHGRRWYLRAGVLLAVAWWALYRRGGLNVALGVAMLALAVVAVSLGRQLRRQAAEAERKIEIMGREG